MTGKSTVLATGVAGHWGWPVAARLLSEGRYTVIGLDAQRPAEAPLNKPTARELIEGMPQVFRPHRAKGVNAVIQFRLSVEGGGSWYATIRDGTCTVAQGVSDAAQATIMMDARDYVALATGKLGGMRAFLTGRVKTTGDFSLLQKMQTWFPR